MKTYIYRGIVILPADRNSSGIRWTARLDNGDLLRADTLQGIRELIRKPAKSTDWYETAMRDWKPNS